ncbi:hypothetical protein Nepgr_020906 [Nepenthes gracilis]|uniref:Elongator complex protein 4 n=1 Tax=Nepenthes gracilis TaxID=150966 RepID=A0AAD3XWP9_NEPGR|nr:hypothetical protein Nepgr_020906 [Nepenthes gracilis]
MDVMKEMMHSPLKSPEKLSGLSTVPKFAQAVMAAITFPSHSISRNPLVGSTSQNPALKPGPNGSIFISSGIPDLDKILGNPKVPHHMLLLRNFMAQGLVQNQPLLYARPSKDPRLFLIAWHNKKYFEEGEQTSDNKNHKLEYYNDCDLRKPLERHILTKKPIECVSMEDSTIDSLSECSSIFLAQNPSKSCAGCIAIQSFCAPQLEYFNKDWDMVSFIKYLKGMIRFPDAVAMITFPHSLLSTSFSKRWQHLVDTLFSVRAIPDDDKELANLLTRYQKMVDLLNVHEVARINAQVPFVLEASTFSIKLRKQRSYDECLILNEFSLKLEFVGLIVATFHQTFLSFNIEDKVLMIKRVMLRAFNFFIFSFFPQLCFLFIFCYGPYPILFLLTCGPHTHSISVHYYIA